MKNIGNSEKKRLALVGIFLFALFSLLIAQFFRIQIIEGEKWTFVANRQHIFSVKEPFQRGTFYSNTGIKKGHPEKQQSFTVDIQKFHLYINPDSIPQKHKDQIAKHLLTSLELSAREKKNLRPNFDKISRSRRLAMWLDREERDRILEWWNPFAKKHKIPRNALYFVSDFQRSYPFGKLLGQVLHTIQNNKDEASQQAIPTGGLELYFNDLLKGKQGTRRLMRSPRNSFETGEVIERPKHGCDIYLTVNHFLQAICEEELAKGVRNCKAKAGWAVMMDPRSGEVLALAQYPFFFPPDYKVYFNDEKLIEHTKVKAITDANEPGSVMKPITAAVALLANEQLVKRGEKPLFSPEEKIATDNGRCRGRKDLKDGKVHRFLNMQMAIQKSSNIYFGRLIERVVDKMGNDWYRDVLQNVFGMGVKTGIELPSESAGLLPTPGRKHPNGALEWSVPTPYSLAMGHNIQTNTLQLVRAFSLFANGGYLVQPTLIKKIIKYNEEGSPEVLLDNSVPNRIKQFPKVLSSAIVNEVLTAIKFTTKPGGTARAADVWGYTEAGKTGTGIKIENGVYNERLNCSSYIGIVPAKEPCFVLSVTMDEPDYAFIPGVGKNHHGGICAAPVHREISRRSLEYLGVPPDDPYGYPTGDPRHDSEKADWMKETRKLQEMYEKWNN